MDKYMKKIGAFLFFLFFAGVVFANDGAYFMSGNQLIPIKETSVEVRKEILSLKRVGDFVEVTVDYTFFNPEKRAKTILVGFEAFSPEGDADFYPKNGQHPYMNDFTVNLNQKILPYEISYVSTENKEKEFSLAEIENSESMLDYAEFYYVYHFNATFQPGNNRLVHTYKFRLSGSVDYAYNFDYVLTAANRWANNKIDDFTLNIDMGAYQDFYINSTFFKSVDEWTIHGVGEKVDDFMKEYRFSNGQSAAGFFIHNGTIQFKKKDFHPKGELFLFNPHFFFINNVFSLQNNLPFHKDLMIFFDEIEDENALKVLQNLPYARRGYVFKNEILKNYYEKMPWYIPNETYVPEPDELDEMEQKWLEGLKNIKILKTK